MDRKMFELSRDQEDVVTVLREEFETVTVRRTAGAMTQYGVTYGTVVIAGGKGDPETMTEETVVIVDGDGRRTKGVPRAEECVECPGFPREYGELCFACRERQLDEPF